MLLSIILLLIGTSCEAWSSSQKSERAFVYQESSRKMLYNPAQQQAVHRETRSRLSHSVLADCDTLPAFPTAHGLLSPETVMRMEKIHQNRNDVLESFLDTYRRHGPLSCLPLLSDPQVLPYLTEAMRNIE